MFKISLTYNLAKDWW